jgi:hypothetical protein
METERAGEGCNTAVVRWSRLDISKIVDTLTLVDMRWWRMFRFLRRSKELAVEFCDRCARICDPSCRAAAIREHALSSRLGVRL